MNRDVFLSLLALDSYNRGYGQNISGLPDVGGIGNATILTDALVELDRDAVEAAGFYAIAYNVSGVDGLSGTVISYRGTNFPTDPFNVDQLLAGYNDVAGGWSIFTGWGTNSHAQLARDFLVSVTGQDFPVGSVTFGIDNLTLTGHSLGGGLAANDNSQILEIAA